MKDLNYLNEYRKPLYGLMGDENNGMFQIPIDNKLFRVIASNGMGVGSYKCDSIYFRWKSNK